MRSYAEVEIIFVAFLVTIIPSSLAIQCLQCAATDGKKCPQQSHVTSSNSHDACITWIHGNGTVLLQNVVISQNECSQERIQFWSRFVDLYYKTTGGTVSCCYNNFCNDGQSQFQIQPQPPLSFGSSNNYPSRLPSSFASSSFPHQSSSSQNLNQVPNYLQKFSERNGNCEHYFDKTNSNEWIPDTLVPLAFDRASESRVGVFYVKLDDQVNNRDHFKVRIVDKSKQNSSMYTIQIDRSGQVQILLSVLEPSRNQNTDNLNQVEDRRESVNTEINFEKNQFQGFWIAVRNGIDISIGRIGDKIISPIANFSDVMREGPDNPYYFGLTVSEDTRADFGVNCDMPGLHFDDTCVSDDDCSEFPNTVCASKPINKGLDSGTRRLPFNKWKDGDTLLRSCWCKLGHIRIPQSAGCYDPVRKVITLQDGCFADYHCNDLPNTHCSEDLTMPRYNKSCQCLPGNKPFLPDPRTGLVEGCAPLTEQDKATVQGCSRRFNIKNKAEWMPETYFPVNQDVTSFFVKFAPEGDIESTDDDTAVIKLIDDDLSRDKMYTIKISKNGGKISLYNSQITRPFFFDTQTEREMDSTTDTHTMRRMQEEYVGFWVIYKYESGIGGQISVGLTNTPAITEYALLRYTDTGRDALKSVRYIGFTNGQRQQSVDYGAMCVIFDYQSVQSPYQSPSLPYPYPYYQTFSAPHPNSRLELPETVAADLVSISSTGSSTTTRTPLPWDIFNLIPTPPLPSVQTSDAVFVPPQDQKVIEPVLKNEYLTKLQRKLLPPPPHLVANFDTGIMESKGSK